MPVMVAVAFLSADVTSVLFAYFTVKSVPSTRILPFFVMETPGVYVEPV